MCINRRKNDTSLNKLNTNITYSCTLPDNTTITSISKTNLVTQLLVLDYLPIDSITYKHITNNSIVTINSLPLGDYLP